jgi:hypothetical protein
MIPLISCNNDSMYTERIDMRESSQPLNAPLNVRHLITLAAVIMQWFWQYEHEGKLIVIDGYAIMDVGPAHDIMPQYSALLAPITCKPATDQPP